MKPFNLEAAKRGDPIITRRGGKARFIAHVPEAHKGWNVVAFIEGDTIITFFEENGARWSSSESSDDLFMAPQKKTVWVNLYNLNEAHWFSTRETADDSARKRLVRVGNQAWALEIEE